MDEFNRKILVVGGQGAPCAALIDYAAQLAARTGCDALVLSGAAGAVVPAGIEIIVQEGDLLTATEAVCRRTRRIEFILTDAPETRQALAGIVPVPVFRVSNCTTHQPGGGTMSGKTMAPGKRPVGRTIILGCLTTALYAVFFYNAGSWTSFFPRGGVYAALPIGCAFLFSFVHAAFASNFWSLLGIEARTRTEAYKNVTVAEQPKKTKIQRPRAHAYVNPFHNIELKK
jgi:hypothetical protein